jgi:hypothetical protein
VASTADGLFVASESTSLSSEDRRILAQVEDSLTAGIEVHRWWKKTDAAGSYRERLDMVRTFNPANRSFAFFDEAALSIGSIPLLGVVQEMTFDFSRSDLPGNHDQIREFVMRYMLRVTDYKRPNAFISRTPNRTSEQVAQLDGWGYSQVYYKRRVDGAVGKFPDGDQTRLVDMREIGKTYEWVVFKARFFNLSMAVPASDSMPHLVVPIVAFTDAFLVTNGDLIVCEEAPEPGVLGRYGFGCATLRDLSLQRGPLLWGPGRFYPSYSAFLFEVRSSGETVVTAPFAVNRPDRVFGIDPDPVAIGGSVLNAMSFGLASRLFPDLAQGVDPLLSPIAALNRATANIPAERLGLSKEGFERILLLEHFTSVYEMLAGAALTYCLVPDWTAPEGDLPKWVQAGIVA